MHTLNSKLEHLHWYHKAAPSIVLIVLYYKLMQDHFYIEIWDPSVLLLGLFDDSSIYFFHTEHQKNNANNMNSNFTLVRPLCPFIPGNSITFGTWLKNNRVSVFPPSTTTTTSINNSDGSRLSSPKERCGTLKNYQIIKYDKNIEKKSQNQFGLNPRVRRI